MKDREIRKILINYILASNSKVRIYQEKSIGDSICDVMTVTDTLTGYEIKSDSDDYSRLDRQIEAYNEFFDRNYLVVTEGRRESAVERIPAFWGIIIIQQDNVEVLRKAVVNRKVSRQSQLDVLWKLELKNILVKNSMSMYAQKSKEYIIGRIIEHVDHEVLGEQIASELYNRDYSVYNACDLTIRNETVINPMSELLERIVEDDTNSISLDQWIGLYSKAKEIQGRNEKKFSEKPKVLTTHNIKYTDIEVALGVPWISVDIVNDFVAALLNINDLVRYEPVTGTWTILNKRNYNYLSNCSAKYGIQRYNALFIIEATLNLREIKLYNEKGKYDEADTIAALEKQKLITEEFRKWIWQDEDRIWEVEEAYNRMFDDLKRKNYDGSKMSFPEMAEGFELYDYQKDAVQRIINEKNTLLAFDVGSGKTYIMIAAAMTMRRMGLSRKNMFVVPNNIVGQWEKIFTDLYPKAKLLTIEPRSFKPELREKIVIQMRDGDYDGIIIAYSCFEMIPLSVNYISDKMQESLGKLDNAVHNLKTYDSRTTAIRREKEYIRKLAKELIDNIETNHLPVTFDELEINTIFLDEAHNFKNIPIRTSMRTLRGINTKGSSKCLDMLRKIYCVQEQNSGRGAVLATGTPLCNSISDTYVMQMYVQHDELEKRKLHIFDNWIKTFAEMENVCEIDVSVTKFRFVRRFSRFYNLTELSLLFSQAAVFHAVDSKDGIPLFEDYHKVIIKKNASLTDYMHSLGERTDLIREKKVDRHVDNMLKVSTDGRKAALDLSLVGKTQFYDDTSKLKRCTDEVMKIYSSYKGTSQIIFCDYSTPKASDFSVYSKLKEILIQKGIPNKEIAFIHNYNTEEKKIKLYQRFNEGVVRILIGSTFKLGIGANVQTKLKAIHHLDVPWRPADMIQREGRILRRGNENEEVFIFRYIAEGSFDAYSWQILETKQRFISQFLSGTGYQRSVSDLESNVLSYGEVKAIALSSPLMKMLAEKENELRSLRILSSKHAAMKNDLQKEYDDISIELVRLKEKIADAEENAKYMNSVSKNELQNISKQYKDKFNHDFEVGQCEMSILKYTVRTPEYQDENKPFFLLCSGDIQYAVEAGDITERRMQRLIRFLNSFDKTANKLKERYDKLLLRQSEIKKTQKNHNPYLEQIHVCENEVEKIRAELKIDGKSRIIGQ